MEDPSPPDWVCHTHTEPETMAKLRAKARHADVVVLTMRNPIDVYQSWVRRGRRLDAWYRALWENLFRVQQDFNGLWLPIDTPDRDDYLKAIADKTGLPLKTDWPKKNAYVGRNNTRIAVVNGTATDLHAGLPFEQFGYDLG